MRLSHSVGRLDWRRALNELEPWELREWQAFDWLEPVSPWQPASVMASVNANEMRMIAAAQSGQKLPPEDLYPSNAFVPGVGEKLKEHETKETIAALDRLVGL